MRTLTALHIYTMLISLTKLLTEMVSRDSLFIKKCSDTKHHTHHVCIFGGQMSFAINSFL